jgi:hypothetical protein
MRFHGAIFYLHELSEGHEATGSLRLCLRAKKGRQKSFVWPWTWKGCQQHPSEALARSSVSFVCLFVFLSLMRVFVCLSLFFSSFYVFVCLFVCLCVCVCFCVSLPHFIMYLFVCLGLSFSNAHACFVSLFSCLFVCLCHWLLFRLFMLHMCVCKFVFAIVLQLKTLFSALFVSILILFPSKPFFSSFLELCVLSLSTAANELSDFSQKNSELKFLPAHRMREIVSVF